MGAALLNHIEGSTDDATLVLDNTAGALLGDLLYIQKDNPVSNLQSHSPSFDPNNGGDVIIPALAPFHGLCVTIQFGLCPSTQSNNNPRRGATDLRDTLAVLATEENSPCDAAGVLALKEKGLGLSTLEAEDLAVATDE